MKVVDAKLIAKVCHEVNKAFCESIGDFSQPSWDDAPNWQYTSAVNGVEGHLNGTIQTAEQSHESWLKEKAGAGWKYGPVKNPDTKEHPCFVPYNQLPKEQQTKNALFKAVVDALK